MSQAQLIDSSLAQQFDRLPPHSVEAEMCLLGSMMLDDKKDMISQIVQIVTRDCFFQTDHQIIFDVLLKLDEQNRGIDAMIVREELQKRQQLEDIGGVGYLAQILNAVPSAAHGMHYASIVREKALLRQLITASNDNLRDAYAPHDKADSILNAAEERIFAIAEKKVGDAAKYLGDVAAEVYSALEDKGRGGTMTQFPDLDDKLNGLQNGEMIIVAGRPSMGKTAFAMNIVENVATSAQKIPCAVFSMEMSRQQLAQRMLCTLSNIDGHKVRRGLMTKEEYIQMAEVVTSLASVPIWVDDSPGLSVLDVRAKARRLKRQQNIGLIMIDYMQLMDNPGPESRQQQITEISRGIKAVARELEIPVICVSQLNRASEGREGHRPHMSDLRESGSIEQDADVVMLLHREDYYKIQMGEENFTPDNTAEVIIAKQRNGPIGTVKLHFDSSTTRFSSHSAQDESFE
jgi:replicative DNA helicase